MSQFVCPGHRIAPADTHTSGPGTAVVDGSITALLAGTAHVGDGQKPVVSVIRKGAQPVLPQPGGVVTGKVTRVSPRLANVEILCVGTKAVTTPFSGIIRSQDVRATEVDKVEVLACFRPGDIVRCEVLSVGDARSYFLTTAKNELGVIFAKSLAGEPMVPVSWQEMQCPVTKGIERRKVARDSA